MPMGGTPPYSFEWTVDRVPAGGDSNALVHTNDGNDFTLHVKVTDATMATGVAYLPVTIDPNYYCE
jgi:hypothetical protein